MRNARLSTFLAAATLLLCAASPAFARRKQTAAVNPNDPTYQLYQLLDSNYGGTLKSLYVLADVFKDPQTSDQLQRVLLVQYDKSRYFGRLVIQVRVVAKLTQEQIAIYTPEQIFGFGQYDTEKFEKINPGPFGQPGDMFFRATDSQPLASAPVTDEVRSEYDALVTKYIIPALKNQGKQG